VLSNKTTRIVGVFLDLFAKLTNNQALFGKRSKARDVGFEPIAFWQVSFLYAALSTVDLADLPRIFWFFILSNFLV
jgi:hypothetical protein